MITILPRQNEYLACRESVGILDMSSFAKFVIKGKESAIVSYLQKLCCADIDIPVGGIVPTGMLNEKGQSASPDCNFSAVEK